MSPRELDLHSEVNSKTMAKRGRPSKNGQIPWTVPMREAYALYGYNEAMKAGEKHDEAVRQAASHVRENLPGIPCSGTEVRRILARWRPRNSPFGWVVSKPDPEDKALTLGLPGIKPLLLVAWGRYPTYSRHNAAATIVRTG